MPDYPQAALTAAAEAVERELRSDTSREALARAALNAAAPILAEEIAQRILRHMEGHVPMPASPGLTLHATMSRAWRRHFGIAARVAAGAFTTEEESKRAAGEALARGDFVACPAPEDGNA